jgi:hypothetical protein
MTQVNDTGVVGPSAPPAANRAVVAGELKRALASRHRNQLSAVLMLRATPEWHDGDLEFIADLGAVRAPVTVVPCRTVLAVLAALAADREDGRYLVILTPQETGDLGDSVLARAMLPMVKPVNRWDLVLDAFGARLLDPALSRSKSGWVAEALLDVQPEGGWRRLTGEVLTRATALNRLAAARLGIDAADESPVDAAALLQWTTRVADVERFFALRAKERDGLTGWLTEPGDPVAEIVFALAAAEKIRDAVPFGLVIAALGDYKEAKGKSANEPTAASGPDEASRPDKASGAKAASGANGVGEPDEALIARVRAEERYLGGQRVEADRLLTFGEAAESLVTRWADNGHAAEAARLCDRAEAILAEISGSPEATRRLGRHSGVLAAGHDARLAGFAAALTDALASSGPADGGLASPGLAAAADALGRLRDHARTGDYAAEVCAAEAAVRVARWLASPEDPPGTLAEAATRMLRSWAWADRALGGLTRAETARVPQLTQAYGALWDRARARRARLDTEFARKLAAWTEGSVAPDELVLVENLLDRIARPLAERRPPVIIVLDGMTAAAGLDLTEELTARGAWVEAGRRADGREPAVATVPSVTAFSRTSLLTGTLRDGDQADERTGFAAFWGRRPSALFHKGDLDSAAPTQPLPGPVRDAILDQDRVVGVVLNAIDDSLDKGHGPARWTAARVTHLQAVLDEARRASRPVILTADHGHVRTWEPAQSNGGTPHPASAHHSESARYRTGTPAPGEILVRGPRVIVPARAGGGAVVAAVDETIHYTPRKAGYHGGASPAEVVVPVVTLLPSEALLPSDWYAYGPLGHAPAWWDAPTPRTPQPEPAAPESAHAQPAEPGGGQRAGGSKAARGKRRPAEDTGNELFGRAEVASPAAEQAAAEQPEGEPDRADTPPSLGARVVASARMAAQRQFVRRAPADRSIAALIDAFAKAGDRLTLTEAALAAGEPAVRMSGYLAMLTRLLNVDGYPVLRTTDEGRTVTLNIPLLRQQFLDG